jgi:membrane-bound lytic murein transglycosylase B
VADYSQDPQAISFINEMVADGYDKASLTQWLAEADHQQSIIDAISRPAEKTKTWKEYRPIFLTKTRIDKGKIFKEENKEALQKAEEKYHVPAEIIVAIIGVETQYGGNKGKYQVSSALATLAFDYPPRSVFFRKELHEFFLLTRDEGISEPSTLIGSYAGAMGYGQFMPSSFRAYAVDFDGDGKKDIWNNTADAIGSVANYLSAHGWNGGEVIAVPTTVDGDDYLSIVSKDLETNSTIEEVKNAGVKPVRCLLPNTKVIAMALEGENGTEVWLGLKNFQVITTYNRSQLYAMAVFQLSQAIQDE